MLKKLKSLFIVEEEGSTEKKKGKQKKRGKPLKKENAQAPEIPTIDPESVDTSKPDPKFINILLKAVEAANIEGFDYLEFKQSLQSLKSMEMDEKTKYQSAFAMAKTMGATSSELLASADHYMKVLQKEDLKFNEALKNQNKIKIEDRKGEIANLEKMIAQKEAQIEALKKDIESHRKLLSKKSIEINNAAAKVQATKQRFERAYQIVLGQIKSDVEKIRDYIEA